MSKYECIKQKLEMFYFTECNKKIKMELIIDTVYKLQSEITPTIENYKKKQHYDKKIQTKHK